MGTVGRFGWLVMVLACSASCGGSGRGPAAPTAAADEATTSEAASGPQDELPITWTRHHPSGPNRVLAAVWAHDGDHAVAVGAVAAHFDDGTWRERPLPEGVSSLSAVWGVTPDDVFAAGRDGAIVHFDGERWTRLATPGTPDVRVLCGLASDDVFATGYPRFLWHWDGEAWSSIAMPRGLDEVLAMDCRAPDDVLMVGRGGLALRWNGERVVEVPGLVGYGTAVASTEGLPPVALASGVFELRDGAWTRVALEGVTGSFWALAAAHGRVLTASHHHAIRFDGEAWRVEEVPAGEGWRVVAIASPTRMFAGSFNGGGLFSWDGARWQEDVRRVAQWQDMVAADGVVFAVGHHGVARHDGEAWRDVLPGPSGDVCGAFGTDGDHMVLLGEYGNISVRTPEGWVEEETHRRELMHPGNRHRLTGTAFDDVWVVGDSVIGHFDGERWAYERWGGWSVLARARDDVWVVGDGQLSHFDGESWSTRGELEDYEWEHAIVLDVAGDVGVIAQGELRRFRDDGWETVGGPMPTVTPPQAAYAVSWDDVYVIVQPEPEPPESWGDDDYDDESDDDTDTGEEEYEEDEEELDFRSTSLLLHFDGERWSIVEELEDASPRDITGHAQEVVVAIDGGFARREGDRWIREPRDDLAGGPRVVWTHGGAVFAAADDSITLWRALSSTR